MVSGGVGSIPSLVVERERGVLLVMNRSRMLPARTDELNRIEAGTVRSEKGEPLDASQHQNCPGTSTRQVTGTG